MRPARRTNILASGLSSAAINLLRFNPTTSELLTEVARYLSDYIGIAQWLVHVGLFFVAWLIIFVTLQYSRAGDWVFQLYGYSQYLYRWLAGRPRQRYPGELRHGREFQRDILRALGSSRFMYSLLFAGYKMLHEEERFLLEALIGLSGSHGKDIRFLLLDRNSPDWHQRASAIVENTTRLRGAGVDGYKQRCIHAEQELRNNIHGAQVHSYQTTSSWRLYLFEDCVFVSRYALPPDTPFRPSSDISIVCYGSNDPMYGWLYSEFRKYCPQEWRDAIPAPPAE